MENCNHEWDNWSTASFRRINIAMLDGSIHSPERNAQSRACKNCGLGQDRLVETVDLEETEEEI